MRLLCFDSVLSELKTDLLSCEAMVHSNPPLKAGCRKAHVAQQCLLKVIHLRNDRSFFMSSNDPQWRYSRGFGLPTDIALRACYPCSCSADFWKYTMPSVFLLYPSGSGAWCFTAVKAPPLKSWFAEEGKEGSLHNFNHPTKGWGNRRYQKVNRKLRQTSVHLQDMWIHSWLQLFQVNTLCCLST